MTQQFWLLCNLVAAGHEEAIDLTCFGLLFSALIGQIVVYPPVFGLSTLVNPILERLHELAGLDHSDEIKNLERGNFLDVP